MTLEEKREAIKKHCRATESCLACPLRAAVPYGEACYEDDDEDQTRADIERNYAILFEGAEPKRVYGDGHADCSLDIPVRLDVLARRPARVLPRQEADREGAQGIDVNLNVRTVGVEEAIEQLKMLNELILKAQVMAEGLSESLKRLEIIVG